MPPELQQRVHEEVKRTKQRSGWPAGKTLAALGLTRTTYYRWLREEAWAKARPVAPVGPVQPYEALPEEKAVVKEYALKHPELRHRELTWRMVDEDVAYLEGEDLADYLQAVNVIARIIRWYNEGRLHSALGFLRPADYYRGNPEAMYAVRRQKLAEARHRRREKNLQLRQPTLPLTSEETVA